MKRIPAALAALLLGGCVTFSGLDPKTNYADIGDASIIVIGVSPRYRVHVFKGEKAGDKWNRDQVATTLNVYPEDGYIVARLPARAGALDYGIGGILPEGIGGGLYAPCKGQRTLTFDAPAGKVVYIADIKLQKSGSSVVYEATADLPAARAHLARRFPLLADRLVEARFNNPELANTACSQTVTVTIPLRVRR